MKLDGVRVQPAPELRPLSVLGGFAGMSVVAPEDETGSFIVGSVHKLSMAESRESYEVLIVSRHPTTLGVAFFLKLWRPN